METAIAKLQHAYRQLCDYCADYDQGMRRTFPGAITCHKGCAACCELTSVNALEAFFIAGCLPQDTGTDSATCPLLAAGCCSIYPARPIICRTHGLPIYGNNLTAGQLDHCPLNFTKTTISRRDALDVEMVTENLMRLNLAFCLTINDRDLAGERILLTDIINHNLPQSLRAILPPS